MDGINNMMSMFNIIIGIICAYAAIVGKGFVYKNDYPKQVQEPYCKMLRRLCIVLAPLTLFMGAEDYFGWLPERASFVVQLSLSGLLFALIVAFIIWFRVKFGKIIDAQFRAPRR